MNSKWALLLLAAGPLLAQEPDTPLGVVLGTGPARLLRDGTQLALALRTGDLLFPGDRLFSDDGDVTLAFCPLLLESRLAAHTSVRLEAKRIAVLSGRIASSVALPFCPAPSIGRAQLARPVLFGQDFSGTRGAVQTRDGRAQLTATQRAMLDAEMGAIDGSTLADAVTKEAGRAAVLSKYGLHSEAVDALNRVAAAWNSVDWPRRLVHDEHDLESRGTAVAPALAGEGQTYAVLVGVSEYLRLPAAQGLEFADRDAEFLYAYLRSLRGGSVPAENIRLLTNKEATVAAIRNSIADFLRARATRADTVVLLLAAHGVAESDGAYILAHDSDPDNLRDSGINMLEIQNLMEGALENVGHVLIFVDVCRAGLIGNIRNGNMSRVLQVLGRLKGEETFGLLASGPGENSFEGSRFGGGHGAFSYFLLRALNGDADTDHDGRVTVNEVQAYVYNMVRQSTRNRQNPRVTGDMPGDRVLIQDLTRRGIEIGGWLPSEPSAANSARGTSSGESAAPSLTFPPALAGGEMEKFEAAIAAGRLLPPDADNAWDLLDTISRMLSGNPLQIFLFRNQLRIALQDRGQQVLLTYLRGEEQPQRREDFEQAAKWFDAAVRLDTEALVWQSRTWFSRARAMLFESRYQEAQDLLERALRIEPEGPYLYNALGLLSLQQADFGRAASAFRDAIRLAPFWSYPRHNLALALTQSGAFPEAIATYRDAEKVAPQAWFIPYNRGLVEQRINRLGDALAAFRSAAALAPLRPEPDAALAYLTGYRGKLSQAENLYRQALAKDPAFLPAMHDLAGLLAKQGRVAEAEDLWKSVLQRDPNYSASRLAWSAILEQTGRYDDALAQQREALARDPALNAARLAAARLLLTLGRPNEAEQEMRNLLDTQPENATAWDYLGDSLASQNQRDAAVDAYQHAVRLAGGEQLRSSKRKLKRILGASR